jgi:hypothetical protein
LVFRWKGENQLTRKPVAREEIERSLTEAVRTSHPEFEDFAGVIVERIVPPTPGAANWAIKGIRFGGADRHRGGIILAYCVDEAQLKFELAGAERAGANAPPNPNG